MFIQTEETPNPGTLKFLPGCSVTGGVPVDFPTRDAGARSPLALGLFAVDGVAGVFLGSDFITVTKAPGRDWATLKPMLLSAIMEHFTSGRPVLVQGGEPSADAPGTDEDSDIVRQIKDLLDQRVRPVVAQDGGDITFHGFSNGVVYLTMKGSCSGCPSSVATLKNGIENMLRHYIPEVSEVRAVR